MAYSRVTVFPAGVAYVTLLASVLWSAFSLAVINMRRVILRAATLAGEWIAVDSVRVQGNSCFEPRGRPSGAQQSGEGQESESHGVCAALRCMARGVRD
jgi:hypothetical protein